MLPLLMRSVWILLVAGFHALPYNKYCIKYKYIDNGLEYFSSPGYPRPYASDSNCRWVFLSPPYTAMKVQCPDFDTPPSVNCSLDSFSIKDSRSYMTGKDYIYCGKGTLEVTTKANFLTVLFLSQNVQHHSHRGFLCFVSVISPDGGAEVSIPDSSIEATPSPTVPPSDDCDCGVKGSTRIIGGQETHPNEWPWQVGIFDNEYGIIFCGATLINTQWVLTAAHCVSTQNANDINLRLGEHDEISNNDSPYTLNRTVSHVIIHQNFDAMTKENDIALLKLQTPVTYNEAIKPICLPFSFVSHSFSGHSGTVLGWGKARPYGALSHLLLEVELPILTTSECRNYNYPPTEITDNMICTYQLDKDACQGDSGGPLLWEKEGVWYIIGIVSFGEGCAKENYPGVYTKVTNYLPWIQHHLDYWKY